MANIAPTQAIVNSGYTQKIIIKEAVASVGQLLTYDSALGGYTLAFCAGTTLESIVYYMALETGIIDASIRVMRPGGIVDLGTVLVASKAYYLSATAGLIADAYTDLISTNFVTSLGIAKDTSLLEFQVLNSRVAIP
jgi:hypothetical protein